MSDDITNLLTAAPEGAAQAMAYRQGKILTFDKSTLANTVSVGGATLTNVPILGVAEAASLAVDSIVGLMVVGSSWAIIGRMVQPNTAEATDAITQVSQRIYTGNMTPGGTSSASYVTLAGTQSIANVRIGAAGRALVLLGAQISFVTPTTNAGGGWMTVSVAGPTTVAASDVNGFQSEISLSPPSTVATVTDKMSAVSLIAGLTPGLYTFTAQYKASVAGVTVNFQFSTLTVFAL